MPVVTGTWGTGPALGSFWVQLLVLLLVAAMQGAGLEKSSRALCGQSFRDDARMEDSPVTIPVPSPR